MNRLLTICFLSVALAGVASAATTADVLFVVDESGSMSGEHAWLASMVTSLDTNLAANGVTGNQYGLVGYGANSSHGLLGHAHSVGGGDWGTAAQFSTATGSLVLSGGTEDGWEAMRYALGNYTFRGNAALNIVLVTDEDRDNADGGASTYANTLAALQAKGAVLNAVVNSRMWTDTGSSALGQDGDGASNNAFLADGSGSFTSAAAGIASAGSMKSDYVVMAYATSGAGWDLNLLRAGGLTADSFTAAFVAVKTAEIQQQTPGGSTVPAPGAFLLGGLGAGIVGMIRRRRLV